jgi:hypothetical protein
MRTSEKILVAAGLALGGVFGLVGTVVAARNLQAAAWAIDGVGLIVATVLLALAYFRKGNDEVAAGFLLFAIGSSVMLAGTAAPLAESGPTFVAGAALWSCALALISIPLEFALWVRLAGLISGALFVTASAAGFWGWQVLPTTKPLPFFAFPFLVLTIAGWLWTTLRAS